MIESSEILSRIPNLRHGFSTRRGGVSVGDFASLNVARNVGDAPGAVEENRRRLLSAIGLEAVAEADQVHGATVIDVERGGSLGVEADGLVSARAGLGVGVRTADCAPILMAALDPEGRATRVAAVHAGWRGATARIAPIAHARLAPHGRVVAAIGPTIGLEAFEVGDEVIEAARASLDGAAPTLLRGPSGRWHLDLRALLSAQLVAAGVLELEQVGGCTVASAERYYSHRRDRGRTGRHLSVIGLASSP